MMIIDMRRSLFFLVCMILCGYSLAMEEVNKSVLSEKVVFHKKNSAIFNSLFKEAIVKIDSNPVGKMLFEILKGHFSNSKSGWLEHLIVEDVTGDGRQNTAFHHGLDFDRNHNFPDDLKHDTNGMLYLYVNFDNAVKCDVVVNTDIEQFFSESECLYKHVFKESILTQSEHKLYPISKTWSPFFVTIVHEFIHCKHFLDTALKREDIIPCGYAATIRTYSDISKSAYIKHLKLLPELSELDLSGLRELDKIKAAINSLRRIIPWSDFEERRTVCGPDIDGISEMAFRIAGSLPIRYIYQGQNFFFEEPSIVEKIVQGVLTDSSKILGGKILQNVLSSLSAGFYSFGLEKSSWNEGLPYSPLSVRQAFFSNEAIVRSRDNIPSAKYQDVINFLMEIKL